MTTAVPSLPTTTPAAWFAMRTALRKRRAGAEQHAERRDHRVAGTRDIEHLARDRGDVLGAGRGEEAHPLLRARDEQRVDVELGEQRLRLRRHLVLVAPAADDLAELGAVWA